MEPAGTTSFTFSPEGTLDRITRPDGAQVSFKYDAAGKRTQKAAPGTATAYGYENGRLASLTRGSDTATFAYDDAGTPLSIETGGQTYAYRYDARGAVIELTDTATHDAAASYRYDAWGQVIEESGDADLRALNPFTFVGAEGVMRDTETGLYLMGARYYDPALGRFIARDPFEAEPNQSSYAYAANNPVSLMDPDGTHPIYSGLGRCLRWCNQRIPTLRLNRALERLVLAVLRFAKALRKTFSGWIRRGRRSGGSARERVLGVLDPCGSGRGISDRFDIPRLGSARWASFGMGCGARTFTLARVGGATLFVPSDFIYRSASGGGGGSGRKLRPSESPFWKRLRHWRKGMRVSGRGSKKKYFEWDYRHGEIEVYNNRGEHLGSLDPIMGRRIKPPVSGRRIDVS